MELKQQSRPCFAVTGKSQGWPLSALVRWDWLLWGQHLLCRAHPMSRCTVCSGPVQKMWSWAHKWLFFITLQIVRLQNCLVNTAPWLGKCRSAGQIHLCWNMNVSVLLHIIKIRFFSTEAAFTRRSRMTLTSNHRNCTEITLSQETSLYLIQI